MTTDTETTRRLVTTYFESWRDHDWDTLRTTLADDVDFVGVMGTTHGIDEAIAGLTGMAEHVMKGLVLKARVVEGADAVTWFHLVTDDAELPTANWSHVEDGKISRIRVTFDPTPLNAGA